ncbi:MAG: DUF3857 domain-containing protein [Bacteroidota bacterium]
MRNIYLFFFCLLVVAGSAYSQPHMDDFGKVSDDELLMTDFEVDPDAPAVVLFELGEVTLIDQSNKLLALYKVHRRVKILSEEGLEWAKVGIPFDRSKQEGVRLQKGLTHFWGSDGGPESIKLNKKTASKEQIGADMYVYKFPMPGAKVGSVVEYMYEFISEEIQSLRPWKFQKDIPVLYSRYDTYLPRKVSYVPVFQGDTRKLQRFVGRYSYNLGRRPTHNYGEFGLSSGTSYQQGFVFGNVISYEMKDVFPLKAEPYTTIPEDNMAQISLELANLRLGSRNQVKTWKMLSRTLLKDNFFGRDLENERFAELAGSQIRGIRNPEQRLEKLFEFIQNEIEWDGFYGPEGTQKLTEVLRRKLGNGADINLLLCALLKGAGFDAFPVLISTRDHGKPQKYKPDITQFNHVIVSTKVRGKVYMLDALNSGVPFNMIPRRDLNDMGFLVDKRNWGWIDIVPDHEVIRNTYTRFFLKEDGSLDGELELIFKEYSAATERGKLEAYVGREDEYIRTEFLEGLPKAIMQTYDVKNPNDKESPVTVLCKLTTPDYVMEVDDLLFVRPLLTKSILDNPFSSEERVAPIDLPCPVREYYLLGLEIPEGYEVVQTPAPIRVVMPNEAGEFSFNVIVDGDILHVSSTIFITKTHYVPQEYEEIKLFFDYIVRKHEEDIVLRKIEDAGVGD